ncbi:MAG: site-2 protease family protein [Deltaproteobacteria bacterium]|nr:site-2 protease family protein [Deltaproteobacteria bacterium]
MSSPASNRLRPGLHLGLLALTLGSTFFTFLVTFGGGGEGVAGAGMFAVALLSILGTHEMGHYVMSRRHGVDCTLPYFIPAPLLGVGTLGAVIRVRSPIPHRDALVDIGAAGPLAGAALAVPVLAVGLWLSPVVPAGLPPPSWPAEGSLWDVAQRAWAAWRGVSFESPRGAGGFAFVFGDPPLLLLLRWLLKGPLPDGMDVQSHPLVVAGWFGLLVTLLNLLPVGQLDGGHVAYAWLGRRWAVGVGRVALAGLAWFALFHAASWAAWLLVAAFVVKVRHPPLLDEQLPLSARRKWVCAGCFVLFWACLMPAPLRLVPLP